MTNLIKFTIFIFLVLQLASSMYVKDFIRMRCSTDPTVTTITYWTGTMYSNIPQKNQEPLFNLYGVNMMRCFQDKQGIWYAASRELNYFLDLKTNLPVDTWFNPYTLENNTVMHVANNPVQSPYGNDDDVIPSEKIGKYTIVNLDINLLYPNVLYNDTQMRPYCPYEKYQATEIFTFITSDDIPSQKLSLDISFKWTRSSMFQPWMNMGTMKGNLLWSAIGSKTQSENLPEWLKKEINQRLPLYLKAPDCYLDKPNETSWTKFRDEFVEFLRGRKFPLDAPITPDVCKIKPRQDNIDEFVRLQDLIKQLNK